jgi:hypothetical protein
MRDGFTCMAFTVSFVPNTGNKFFVAACDEHLRLYDFEQAAVTFCVCDFLPCNSSKYSFCKLLKTCILPIAIAVNLSTGSTNQLQTLL